jgi:hypothetical protein
VEPIQSGGGQERGLRYALLPQNIQISNEFTEGVLRETITGSIFVSVEDVVVNSLQAFLREKAS